jgi:hypothetical protein
MTMSSSRCCRRWPPAALELSVTAAGQAEARRVEAGRIWRQRLERADFACDRARRQYQLAEPENRLVAASLSASGKPRSPSGRGACTGRPRRPSRPVRPGRRQPHLLPAGPNTSEPA